jgi:hypothetical protein
VNVAKINVLLVVEEEGVSITKLCHLLNTGEVNCVLLIIKSSLALDD